MIHCQDVNGTDGTDDLDAVDPAIAGNPSPSGRFHLNETSRQDELWGDKGDDEIRAQEHAFFDTVRRRTALLAGVSLVALVLAANTVVADVETAPLVVTSVGGAGDDKNNVAVVGAGKSGGTGKSNSPVAVVVTKDYEIEGNTPAIRILSAGGRGGNGQASDFANGGDGGTGGTAAKVELSTSASGVSASTTANSAQAILVDIIGGNGGNGREGAFDGGRGKPSGGALGSGGVISKPNNWTLSTQGDNSHGFFGLVFAGDGGDGGAAENGKGGNGGVGSTANPFSLSNVNATINTRGNNSPGIEIEVVAGAGGDGGSSDKGSGGSGGAGGSTQGTGVLSGVFDIQTLGAKSAGISYSMLGGAGGQGGDGGWFKPKGGGTGGNSGVATNAVVTVDAGSTILTEGLLSPGISVQSIGGRGGAGATGTGLVSFGASGGSAGNSGTATVVNNGRIATQGDGSTGIVAHSIGGGGGAGGQAFGAFYSDGGSGGPGGTGGDVNVTNTGRIGTSGNSASGISAQSIGGSGGSGGGSGSIFALGGRAASASNGGNVTVTNTGTIRTGLGSNDPAPSDEDIECVSGCSHGILAQSIGGGGGNGGSTGGWISVGGAAAGGGDGGSSTVNWNGGSISTTMTHSNGVLAQSIGGGGGNGGGSVAVGPIGAVAIGGSGGGAGAGGAVTITKEGRGGILTFGDNSHGLHAQSVGGGGGNGGFSTATAVDALPAVAVAIGGTGGGGGNASTVTVDASNSTGGSILTLGDGAHAVFAQSVGGGGGNGGFALALSGSATASVSVAVGGGTSDSDTQTSGGNGGNVTADVKMPIGTEGDRASALLAQSIGGGGGNGGFAISGAASGTGGEASLGIGGRGGAGGNGGTVTVNREGSGDGGTTTTGDNSGGIVAQSIGGGGGNGGFAISASVGFASTANVGLSLGASGGGGGRGSAVTVTNGAQIVTTGERSGALIAQSIGGGGGTGGFSVSAQAEVGGEGANLGVSIGGPGGAGNTSGAVTVNSNGGINTSGDHAEGILAQSIGGGGGSGGLSADGSLTIGSGASLGVSVGGSGAPGAHATGVIVRSRGVVRTEGDQSDGILVQSIGGGGGNGGTSVSAAVNTSSSTSLSGSFGGKGEAGGDGGTATVMARNNILTFGAQSDGIVAQSIGGGGGNGGLAVSADANISSQASTSIGFSFGGGAGGGGIGKTVTVNSGTITSNGEKPKIKVTGDGARGIVAQSIGGGGGNGGTAVSGNFTRSDQSKSLDISLGGNAGTGVSGGEVIVNFDGDISTGTAADANDLGLNAEHGILAQSIGGGGGDGGTAVVGTSNKGNANANVLVGGLGSGGGLGGDVTVTKGGSTTTHASGSHGIFAQSIGGGGGNGGSTSLFQQSGSDNKNKSLVVTVGRKGGGGQPAGAVTVTNTGTITTSGLGSHGIFAHSVGGGGGNGGANVLQSNKFTHTNTSLAVGVGGAGGSGGPGGAVTVNHAGSIFVGTRGATDDDDASDISAGYAIFAKSVSNGGGNGGIGLEGDLTTGPDASLSVGVGGSGGGAGNGGVVTVNVTNPSGTDTINSYNDDAHAVVAQSIGGGGGNGAAGIDGDVTNGGGSALVVGVGGSGEGGGKGGAVKVTVDTAITTHGDGAKGIFAQSKGGGGGTGSMGINGSLTGTKNTGSKQKDEDANTSSNTQFLVGIGGAGDKGGDGGTVTVNANANITTGVNADTMESTTGAMDAIYAKSVGGGGGVAGGGVSGDVTNPSAATAAAVGVSGNGAGAGNGGNVSVRSTGAVLTVDGDGSRGIVGLSYGGGGGEGAMGIDGNVKGEDQKKKTAQLDVGIGGRSGNSGDGGRVGITSSSDITTNASGNAAFEENHGIFAHSVGGGGGTGGMGIGGDVTSASQAKALNIGIGGGAGSGGRGGAVVATNNGGTINVSGNNSIGIYAQSVGGGGGVGGGGIDGDISSQDKAESVTQLSVALGGRGGSGGSGGRVTVTNHGTVTSSLADGEGSAMHGILAQSIGGGGGSGGIGVDGTITGAKDSQALTLTIGGTGGGGGNGASGSSTGRSGASTDVTKAGVGVENTAAITVVGDGSVGIMAQNIGGGGGNGAVGLNGGVKSGGSNAVTLAFGATGGAGGDGGIVTVLNTGTIITGTADTTDDDSISGLHGVFAQSIGGGGGAGQLTGSLTFGDAGGNDEGKGLAVNLGASAVGGSGGEVFVSHGRAADSTVVATDIITHNAVSHGLFAQSVGGGGGSAGDLGGISSDSETNTNYGLAFNMGASASGTANNGGKVTVFTGNTSTIQTFGTGSYGILAQSIGGGGGVGGDSTDSDGANTADLAINLGGTSTKDSTTLGDGGQVNVSSLGSVSTAGEHAVAVMAQSVGAGGGKAGGGAAGAKGSTFTLGATANATGNGGAASFADSASSSTSTTGNSAPAVVVQSIGGGGGYAGTMRVGSSSNFGSGLDFGTDDDTASGNGATATAIINGTVGTSGNNAIGVFAQSVGGGGGVLGSGTSSALIGSGGASGTAAQARVSIQSNAMVQTTGNQSHAVFVQSAGGKGSSRAAGNKAVVTVMPNGVVSASGAGSHGIYAQSSGNGAGAIAVTVDNNGFVQGGTANNGDGEDGAAVFVRGGTDANVLTNHGTIRSVDGDTGVAINAQGTVLSITNTGTVVGDILGDVLGDVQNDGGELGAMPQRRSTFVNSSGGIVNATMITGMRRFVNNGILIIGTEEELGVTVLEGHFVQGPTGQLVIDLNARVMGDDGDEGELDILSLNDGADVSGEVLINVTDHFQAVEGVQTEEFLVSRSRIAADALTVRPSVVAQYELLQLDDGEVRLQYDIDFANDTILRSVSENQQKISAALQQNYRAEQLDHETALALISIEEVDDYVRTTNTLSAEVVVDNAIQSLRGSQRFGDDLLSCASRDGNTRFFDDGECNYASLGGRYTDRARTSDNLGFDERTWSVSAGGQRRVAEDWILGGGITYEYRNLSINDAVSSSNGHQVYAGLYAKRMMGAFELAAAVTTGFGSFDIDRNPLGLSASGNQEIWSVGGVLRAAYVFERSHFFAKPSFSIGVDHANAFGFTETGNTPMLLSVKDSSDTFVHIKPKLEVGGDFQAASGLTFRPYASVGVTHYLSNPSASTTASFVGGPAQFDVETELDDTTFDLTLNLDLFTKAGATFRSEAFASIGSDTTTAGGRLRVEIPF